MEGNGRHVDDGGGHAFQRFRPFAEQARDQQIFVEWRVEYPRIVASALASTPLTFTLPT